MITLLFTAISTKSRLAALSWLNISVRFALRPTQAWQLDRDVIALCQGPIEGLGSTPGTANRKKKSVLSSQAFTEM